MTDLTTPLPFVPVVPPPSDHHTMAVGGSTEFGDSAKTAMEKINAGFAHIYSVLRGGSSAPDATASPVAHSLLSDIEARLKDAETKLEAIPAAAATDLSGFVKSTDLASVVNDIMGHVTSHTTAIAAIKDEMAQLEATLNRAVNLMLASPKPNASLGSAGGSGALAGASGGTAQPAEHALTTPTPST